MDIWGIANIEREAFGLLKLVTTGHESPEAVQALIAVSREDRQVLAEMAAGNRDLGVKIARVLQFRKKVGEEFQRLIEEAGMRSDCELRGGPVLNVYALEVTLKKKVLAELETHLSIFFKGWRAAKHLDGGTPLTGEPRRQLSAELLSALEREGRSWFARERGLEGVLAGTFPVTAFTSLEKGW